jgi:leader peptidase (prepilin peptidase)/N-methyltransferase
MAVAFGTALAPTDARTMVTLAALCLFSAAIMVSDLETLTIPDWATIGIGGTALLSLAAAAPALLAARLGAGLAVLALLWLAAAGLERMRGQTVIGLGDVKLIGAATVLVGLDMLPLLLALAAGAALAFALLRAWRKGRPIRRRAAVPFGAFLAPGLVLVWCVGQANLAAA